MTLKSNPYISEKDIIIMQMVADGFTALEIADKTWLSERTVEGRVYRLKTRFKAKTLTHLAIILIRLKVIR